MAMRHLTLPEHLRADLAQLTADAYRYAERLPDGAVVVVGANGYGAEIAEDLHLAGRRVHLLTSPVASWSAVKGLSGCGNGVRINLGALVHSGLRLYGELLTIDDGRMIAAPGRYLGSRTTELNLLEADVTSVIWADDAAEQLGTAAA